MAHRAKRKTTDMKFELRKISYNKRLSQETNAFAADIWCDGVKVGFAENDGHGGSTNAQLVPEYAPMKIKGITKERAKEIYDWIKAQPPKVYPTQDGMKEFSVPMSLDVIVDDLLEAYLDEKYGEGAQKKKWCKRSVCFRLKGDKHGSYRTIPGKDKGVYTKRLKDHLVKTHGDKIEEILNETFGEMPQ